MTASDKQLEIMYRNQSTEALKVRLADCDATVSELLGYGRSWALDCREMQIAESNSSYLRAELRRRETGTSEIHPSQVGEVVERKVPGW